MDRKELERIVRIEQQIARHPNTHLATRLDDYKRELVREAAVAELIEAHADELSRLENKHRDALEDGVRTHRAQPPPEP